MSFVMESFGNIFAQVAEFSLDSVDAEERRHASKQCTALVRVVLNVFGIYRALPPFASGQVVEEASGFIRSHGILWMPSMLHKALMLHPTNEHAYLYLVRCLAEFPHLWYRDAEAMIGAYLKFRSNVANGKIPAPEVNAFFLRMHLEEMDHKLLENPYAMLLEEWAITVSTVLMDLGKSELIRQVRQFSHYSPRVAVPNPGRPTLAEIEVVYNEHFGYQAFADTSGFPGMEMAIALKEVYNTIK